MLQIHIAPISIDKVSLPYKLLLTLSSPPKPNNLTLESIPYRSDALGLTFSHINTIPVTVQAQQAPYNRPQAPTIPDAAAPEAALPPARSRARSAEPRPHRRRRPHPSGQRGSSPAAASRRRYPPGRQAAYRSAPIPPRPAAAAWPGAGRRAGTNTSRSNSRLPSGA